MILYHQWCGHDQTDGCRGRVAAFREMEYARSFYAITCEPSSWVRGFCSALLLFLLCCYNATFNRFLRPIRISGSSSSSQPGNQPASLKCACAVRPKRNCGDAADEEEKKTTGRSTTMFICSVERTKAPQHVLLTDCD